MAIEQITIAGYRSIRKLNHKLGRVNLIVGPNGCGKTNLIEKCTYCRLRQGERWHEPWPKKVACLPLLGR